MESIGGSVITIGDARAAMKDRRLTVAERSAVKSMLDGVNYLRARFGYAAFDQAGGAVSLLLRSNDANLGGPYAQPGRIGVSERNPVSDVAGKYASRNEVLPFDVALHELTHVIQMSVLGAEAQRLHPALTEGLADALAMLSTGDWRIGERYFKREGRTRTGSIRDVSDAPRGRSRMGEKVVADWRKVRDGQVEPHAAGGVISRTMLELQGRIGRKKAQDLLWAVVNDANAWQGGGSWTQLVSSLQASAQRLWPGDQGAATALAAALRVTHLDEAAAAGQPSHAAH